MLSLNASASEPQMIKDQEAYIVNEFDYIQTLTQLSDTELEELALEPAEVQVIVGEFYVALDERSEMTNTQLASMGYTPEEIELLQKYAAGEELSVSEYRAIAGTCTGDIIKGTTGTKMFTFSYIWEWDHQPLIYLTDSAAMAWQAIDPQGYAVDAPMKSYTSVINYCSGTAVLATKTGEREANLDFNGINISFPVTQFMIYGGMEVTTYAKSGRIEVSISLAAGIDNTISYIKVAGLYAHTTVGVGAPSMGLSSGGIDISFSGNIGIDKIAGKKKQITASGIETEI